MGTAKDFFDLSQNSDFLLFPLSCIAKIGTILVKMDIDFEFGEARLENQDAILRDIEEVKPTHVINAAGKVEGSGSEEDPEMVTANLVGALNLAAACQKHQGIHLCVLLFSSSLLLPPLFVFEC